MQKEIPESISSKISGDDLSEFQEIKSKILNVTSARGRTQYQN